MLPTRPLLLALGACLSLLPASGIAGKAERKKAQLLLPRTQASATQTLDCTGATPLVCGSSIDSTTVGLPNHASTYACAEFDESGGEAIYELTLSTYTQVSVTLSGMSADLDLFLLGSCDVSTCVAASAGVSNESIVECLAPGVYYLVVDGYAGSSSAFSLDLACAPCAPCTPAAANGTCASATPIQEKEALFVDSGATCCAADDLQVDSCTQFSTLGRDVVYRLDMPPGCTVDVTLEDGSDGQPLDLSLYLLASCVDPQTSCMAGSDQQVVGPESFSYTSSAGGIYYLVVDSFGNETCGDYDLRVEFTNCSVVGVEATHWQQVKSLYR